MFEIPRWQSPNTLLFANASLRRALAATARPYRGRIALLTLLIVGGTLLPLAPPLLYRTAIDRLIGGSAFEAVLPIAVAAGVLTVLGILLTYSYATMASSLGRRIIADLQMQMYERLASMPLEFFTTLKGGAASARLTTDVYAAEPLFSRTLVGLVANVLMLLGALAVLISVDVRLAVALLVVPPIFKFVEATERQIRQLIRVPNELNTDLATAAESLLSTPGMTLARQSGQLPREIDRFSGTVERLRHTAATLAELGTRITTGYNLTFGIATSILFVGGAWLAAIGQLSIGSLVLFLLYIRLVQIPITAIGGLRYEALGAARAFERAYEVLSSESDGGQRATDDRLQPTNGKTTGALDAGRHADGRGPRRTSGTTAELEFDDVRFRYRPFAELAISSLSQPSDPSSVPTGDPAPSSLREMPWILNGVSFSVARGELVAIVGASGAGKSTIALLAASLYQPMSGTVRVAGESTLERSEADLAERVALITQDTYVLHDTVRGNLRYVNGEASDAEIAGACNAAHLGPLITSMPDGLETIVGERGYRLSGGERQRLAVARALLKDADLIILDEPTSQLDAETELLIKETTRQLFAEKAVLTIAHRLSTIVDANRILVLHRGKIIEEGTHQTLMALAGGRYAALYGAQVRGAA